jgi:acetaldehyde dehydrogenase (acetylating)
MCPDRARQYRHRPAGQAATQPGVGAGLDGRHRPASDGLKRAREMGIKTTAEGVDGLTPHMLADGVQIVFDATSAYVHADNSRKVNALGALMIDLTPAAIGPFCVPPVNLIEHVGKGEMNVNMVTCGGQATIPDGGSGEPRATGGLRRNRRHRVEQVGRPRYAQEH